MTTGELKEKEAFLAKAESCLEQGLYQMAQDIALDWLARFPEDADARIIVCHAWMRMGKLEKVKLMLREVDEAIFSMSRIYARVGDICRQSGLNGEATAFYRRFIALNPDSPITKDVSEKLNALLPSQSQTFFSDEDETAECKTPLSGLKTVTMAELYVKQGHRDLALEVLEKILEEDSANLRAAALLSELQAAAAGKTMQVKGLAAGKVAQELSRWLRNVDRIRVHAA